MTVAFKLAPTTRLKVKLQSSQVALPASAAPQQMANPAEIGAAATFLASDDSSFMTASELAVDGGLAQIYPKCMSWARDCVQMCDDGRQLTF